MINILNDLVLWVFVASADAGVATIMWRIVTGSWWWQKQIKKPWSFSISSDGWSFSAQDFNPIETLRKVVSHLLGNDKSVEDMLKQQVDEYLRSRAKNFMSDGTMEEVFKGIVKKVMDEYLNKKK